MTGDPGGDVTIGKTTAGKVVVVPVAIRRLGGPALDAYGDLERAALDLARARAVVEAAVIGCREEGISWDSIGWAVGTTGEAARQRWRDADVEEILRAAEAVRQRRSSSS